MKHSLTFLFTFCLFFTIVSCQTPSVEKGRVDLLEPTAFIDAYQEESTAVLLDCRTPGEVNRGKVDGAINIDYRSPAFASEVEKLDKSTPVYIYCQVGGRSAAAAKQLKALGFEDVHDMKGGYQAYSKN